MPEAAGALQSYQYQGLADPVIQADGNGIALRQTLDSFGELSAQNWVNVSTNASVDDHVYAYDADGNVIAKDDLVTPAGGQTFGYDNLNRITSFAQGVISDGAIASPASSQGWTYDALGNQLAVTSNGTPVSQTFNSQNQLTSTGSTTLGYDNAGNTTTDQNGTACSMMRGGDWRAWPARRVSTLESFTLQCPGPADHADGWHGLERDDNGQLLQHELAGGGGRCSHRHDHDRHGVESVHVRLGGRRDQ